LRSSFLPLLGSAILPIDFNSGAAGIVFEGALAVDETSTPTSLNYSSTRTISLESGDYPIEVSYHHE
jgi:hypothetical protein